MDFTVVSAYENVSDIKDCSESVLYQAVNNVLLVTTINGNKIFCPLCVKTFEFKYVLLDHLKNTHYHFLRRATEKSFTHEQCPFCYANFFGRHTIIKHVLQNHSKLIAQLYIKAIKDSDPASHQCLFCSETYRRKCAMEFSCHIEQKHFLQFTELFEEQFIRVNESVLSAKSNETKDSRCLKDTNIPVVSESHKENHFDFSDLKEQLPHVERFKSNLKSILKSNITKVGAATLSRKTKVCRVLQFELPDENKENSVLLQNIQSKQPLTLAEHSLLCDSKTRELLKDATGCSTACIQPIHCSTPKYNTCTHHIKTPSKNVKSQLKRKPKVKKATFKSYFFTNDFIFQCGKCKKFFQENTELHSHIKKNHKLFILNLLHPCYQCAICEAKFYKNYYLKKHIILHTGCNE